MCSSGRHKEQLGAHSAQKENVGVAVISPELGAELECDLDSQTDSGFNQELWDSIVATWGVAYPPAVAEDEEILVKESEEIQDLLARVDELLAGSREMTARINGALEEPVFDSDADFFLYAEIKPRKERSRKKVCPYGMHLDSRVDANRRPSPRPKPSILEWDCRAPDRAQRKPLR